MNGEKLRKEPHKKSSENKINFSNYKNLNSLKKLIEKAKIAFKDTSQLLQENHLKYF